MDKTTCERCQGRRWIPVEGTITAAIEAHHGKGRVPCPECSTDKPKWVLGEDEEGMFLYQPGHEDDYSFPIHVPTTDPAGEMEKARDALNYYPVLAAACAGIPTEALTPGSVKALVEAAEAAHRRLTFLHDGRIVAGVGKTVPIHNIVELELLEAALAPFKGAEPKGVASDACVPDL